MKDMDQEPMEQNASQAPEASVAPAMPPSPNTQPPASGIPAGATTANGGKDMTVVCASCGSAVPMFYTFCPHCGKPLNAKPLSTTLFSQIWIYAVSVLLPPLGLWPGIKYFRSSDAKAQRMGTIAIVLTVASTIITLWLTFAFVQNYINDINSALNGTGISPSQATGGLL